MIGTTTIFWTLSDYKNQGMPTFTIFKVECLVIKGMAAITDKQGRPIIGKFLMFRIMLFGLGFGFDYLIEKANEDNK